MSLAFAVMVKERLGALEDRIAVLEQKLATYEEKTDGYSTSKGQHRAARKNRSRVSVGGTEPSEGGQP